MALFNIFARQDASLMLKIKAVFNVLGMVYFAGTVSTAVMLAWFVSIPKLAEALDFSSTKHYLLSLYLCINTVGNYLLTVFTDTSTGTLHVHRDGKLPSAPATGGVRSGIRSKRKNNTRVRFSDTDTMIKPWRSYDCQLCNSCILKRDHHCFFVGYCVGYHNQKYFIQCCAYVACGCFYSLILTTLYLHTTFGTQFQGPWTFFYLLPLTVLSWLQGVTPLGEFGMVLFLYICLVGGVVGIGFFIWESHITFLGLTTYEAMHGLPGPRKGSIRDNFWDVFGKYWYVGLFLPIKLPQYGNGTYTHSAEKRC